MYAAMKISSHPQQENEWRIVIVIVSSGGGISRMPRLYAKVCKGQLLIHLHLHPHPHSDPHLNKASLSYWLYRIECKASIGLPSPSMSVSNKSDRPSRVICQISRLLQDSLP